jgi:hypothetical protein
VRKRHFWAIALLLAAVLAAADTPYLSAKRKFDRIESDRLQAGTRIQLTPGELNAYAEHEVPEGVRNPRLRLVSPGVATGTALVDFVKLRRAQGAEPGWLMTKLFDGERPVSVTARISSANGQATVDVEQVQVSGMTIDGSALDFLIQNVLLPLYPDAAVGRPFELGHRIEQLSVQPGAVTVLIGR